MAIAINTAGYKNQSAGSEGKIECTLALDNNYPNGGYTLNASAFSLSQINRLKLQPEQGYEFVVEYASPFQVKVHVFQAASGTTSSVSAGTPAGTVAAPLFTGAPVAPTGTVAAPVFSGTAIFPATTLTIFHSAAPTGNPLFVTQSIAGGGSFFSSNAIGAADVALTLANGAKVGVDHNAGGGTYQVYYKDADGLLYINNSLTGASTTIQCFDGSVMVIRHDAAAGGAGFTAVVVHDATPQLEATFGDAVNHTVSTANGSGWVATTPAGTNGAPAFAGDPYTPAGTNNAPAFTGVALAGHTHTIGAGAGSEVPNGTNLAALTAIEAEVYGY